MFVPGPSLSIIPTNPICCKNTPDRKIDRRRGEQREGTGKGESQQWGGRLSGGLMIRGQDGQKLKVTKKEDDQKLKTTKMEDNPNGRRPEQKKTRTEDDLNESSGMEWNRLGQG